VQPLYVFFVDNARRLRAFHGHKKTGRPFLTSPLHTWDVVASLYAIIQVLCIIKTFANESQGFFYLFCTHSAFSSGFFLKYPFPVQYSLSPFRLFQLFSELRRFRAI
jgi:hypothetical protein